MLGSGRMLKCELVVGCGYSSPVEAPKSPLAPYLCYAPAPLAPRGMSMRSP